MDEHEWSDALQEMAEAAIKVACFEFAEELSRDLGHEKTLTTEELVDLVEEEEASSIHKWIESWVNENKEMVFEALHHPALPPHPSHHSVACWIGYHLWYNAGGAGVTFIDTVDNHITRALDASMSDIGVGTYVSDDKTICFHGIPSSKEVHHENSIVGCFCSL